MIFGTDQISLAMSLRWRSWPSTRTQMASRAGWRSLPSASLTLIFAAVDCGGGSADSAAEAGGKLLRRGQHGGHRLLVVLEVAQVLVAQRVDLRGAEDEGFLVRVDQVHRASYVTFRYRTSRRFPPADRRP